MVEQSSAWRRFWNRGGFWRALLLAAVYLGVYELLGFLLGLVDEDLRGEEGSASYVFFATALPIIITSVLLIAFAASVGWLRELFARQTLPGRRWMWIALIVVLAINVAALFSIDYEEAGLQLVFTWLLAGLFVGFVEELVTRGFVVNLMRKGGHGEIAVALASAGIFAALHFTNLFTSTQGLGVTLLQIVYTFFFGICMYLILRVTRTLIAPILVHASTDPTIFLHGEYPSNSLIGILPTLGTYLVILAGAILLVVFIVSERRGAKTGLPAARPGAIS
ncbi:CPBP family intramembrane glutamic endopeptidase [Microbacterium sp. SSM24]|uniref:CPBP family intramembrane glutamic endopeptidase n=1 Tax=Microbacterium sp. SSM24 TaxID=2991714 RepID=UPI002227AF37|nr:CPBP family glutamic-type intramembrane protease [Microbacterium sp. SSM24]MCW3493046.1 CPBP family glutamic-type intramembrane protease [Microbacterium sp. SSM24]